jgi:DNA-binding beta-propeller fold protein YncE
MVNRDLGTTMMNRHSKIQFLILVVVIVLATYSNSAQATIRGTFLYNLSSFTGAIPFSWAGLAFDREQNEVYVCDTANGVVRIFNASGMEVYNFGEDGTLGGIYSVAIDEDGDIFVLSYLAIPGKTIYKVFRCNYRGDLKSEVEIKNVPPEFSKIWPINIIYRKEHLYLVDKTVMKVVVTNKDGLFENGYDIGSILRLGENKKANTGIVGFDVDKDGNLLFTIPVLFQAYKLFPDKTFVSFGHRGSAPGKFNVIAGITSDDKGNIYITDTLKCAVMVFDKDFNFQVEFGYRGFGPGNLIAPRELVVSNDGRVYVNQSRRRGVSVFKIIYN